MILNWKSAWEGQSQSKFISPHPPPPSQSPPIDSRANILFSYFVNSLGIETPLKHPRKAWTLPLEKHPFCFIFTRMSSVPSPPWRPKLHPGSDSPVEGCRWPPSKHHCIFSFIHCAGMMKELVGKENFRACQNPGERAEQSGEVNWVLNSLCEKRHI